MASEKEIEKYAVQLYYDCALEHKNLKLSKSLIWAQALGRESGNRVLVYLVVCGGKYRYLDIYILSSTAHS